MADNKEGLTQVTFHFTNGQTESYNVLQQGDNSLTVQELQQKFVRFLEKSWCVLHLPEQTICINTANVLKIEIKPTLTEIHGEGVFSNARRVTALARSAQR